MNDIHSSDEVTNITLFKFQYHEYDSDLDPIVFEI